MRPGFCYHAGMNRRPLLPLLLLALVAPAGVGADAPERQLLAPGWRNLSYEAPAAGSYALPPIMRAADGAVLLEDGAERRLFDLLGDRLVLFSFIYTRCSELNGCPLANAVLHKLQARLAARPELAAAVRLLSMSFDPARDTPAVMREFGRGLGGEGVDWRFLTTRDRAALQPLLDGYGQYTLREYDETGDYTGEIAHTLRVFLIDRARRVRNIYSVSFLHADILLNDLETLRREAPAG